MSSNQTFNKGNTDVEETITDEKLEQFRKETFGCLRKTALKAVKTRFAKNGVFVPKIRNAVNKFSDSFIDLERTKREHFEDSVREMAKLMMETKFFDLNCDIFMYTYMNGWHHETEKICSTRDSTVQGAQKGDEDELKFIPMRNSLLNAVNFSGVCDDFAIALANKPGFIETVKQMLEYFQHCANEEESKRKETDGDLIEYALLVVLNMSMRESNVSRIRDAGMIACLKRYLQSPTNKYALMALSSLAGIINEEECNIINSNKHTVELLLDLLRKGLKVKIRRCEGWSCKECGFYVKILARNDANVTTLVDLGALELLVELGRTGDEDEQYESVSALWALSFDKKVKILITDKSELGVMELLDRLKSSENEKIKKACYGAWWTLRDDLTKTSVAKFKKIGEEFRARSLKLKKETHVDKRKQVTSDDKASSQGHVMISYQWADQQVLKIVRDNIKARGYKVWMDIDQMEGSTLQAMADAVEGAAVILLCMSNKYKHSQNCRAEAEYAFKLRKHIIPLKMERGYTPDGWLGFIVGSKLFFEFSSKYPFETKMKDLLKEIKSVLGKTKDMPVSEDIITFQSASVTRRESANSVNHADTASTVGDTIARISVSKSTIDNVSKWTADDVTRWIEKNDLQSCGISMLTGGELALLTSWRVECPEYFYKCLEKKLKIKDLITISKIFLAFHNLS